MNGFRNSKKELSNAITHTLPNSWEMQDREIAKLTRSYMDGFKHRDLYLTACKDGWDWHLYSYAFEVAQIQAMMITGAKVGFDSTILGFKERSDAERFLDEQRGLCASGFIEVSVPTRMIEKWKAMAASKAEKKGNIRGIE